jgi:hypothetical protein
MANLNDHLPCIAVASHINKASRIPLLINTLLSLLDQSAKTSVYLSISFENQELQDIFVNVLENHEIIQHYPSFYTFIRPNKTPQMRHYAMLFDIIAKNQHAWILFCDDDDIYDKDRVKVFSEAIREYNKTNNNLAGLYESTFGKHHREHRHEYWCYCVHIEVLQRFLRIVHKYADILDHQCCDVLFGEYLRRLRDDWIFLRITDLLYHYKTEDNGDSITNVIQKTRSRWQSYPPPIGDPLFPDYMLSLDDYLQENISLYLHDTYLRTLVGNDFDLILQHEFKADYPYLHYIDNNHIDKIKEYHQYIRSTCDELYDNKLP